MERQTIKSEGLLLITAAIWGFAFVAQRAGMEHLGPFSFNSIRFALGSIVLVPFILFLPSDSVKKSRQTITGSSLLFWGVLSGVVLFGGASLQQAGIVWTTAGKAGFITGLYVIIVPALGLFLGEKPGRSTLIGAVLAVLGLYFLSVKGNFTMSKGDALVLGSAFFWALHVVIIGQISKKTNNFALASIQFGTVSILSFGVAVFAETMTLEGITKAMIPLLYAGLMSTGIAYTLQVVAQKNVPSTHAAIIMSSESVFAVIGGCLMLSEGLSAKAMAGCGLMMLGMLISQREI